MYCSTISMVISYVSGQLNNRLKFAEGSWGRYENSENRKKLALVRSKWRRLIVDDSDNSVAKFHSSDRYLWVGVQCIFCTQTKYDTDYVLERVGVLNGDVEDKLVLLLHETAIQLRQVNQTCNVTTRRSLGRWVTNNITYNHCKLLLLLFDYPSYMLLLLHTILQPSSLSVFA